MDKEKILRDTKTKFDESYSTLSDLYMKVMESHNFVAGNQVADGDARNLRKKNITPLVYNYSKKNVDALVGIQKQNRTALKCIAEEIGDNVPASIASRVLHFCMRKGNGYMASSQAFKDMCIGGLSWISPYLDFSEDPINGEFKVICDSTLDIFFDPHTKEMDLSDCTYIIKRKVIDKQLAMLTYPDSEKEIEDSSSNYKSDYFVTSESGLKNKCVVKEKWERVIKPHYTIVAGADVFTIPESSYDEMQDDINILKQSPDGYAEMRHNKRCMNLTITINDSIIVYDGPSIYEGDFFPFIPVWGFYDKTIQRWSMKIQSLIDALKDPQREINNWKAHTIHYLKSMINSGWIIDKNAVDDERVLAKGMSTPIIRRNPGKSIERIQPLDVPTAFINQGQSSYQDFMQLGLDPNMLGQGNIESAKLAKLKQAQGLANVGELTDNYNYAFTNLGKIALSMILQYYTLDKIKKILGVEYAEITQEDIEQVRNIKYDIEVDETTYSPTQKAIRLETLLQMQQYGVANIKKEEFLEQMELDATDLTKYKARAQEEEAQQKQIEAQNAQAQNELALAKANSEKAKADNMQTQSTLMGTNIMKNLAEQGVSAGDITAHAQAKEQQAMEEMQGQQQAGMI